MQKACTRYQIKKHQEEKNPIKKTELGNVCITSFSNTAPPTHPFFLAYMKCSQIERLYIKTINSEKQLLNAKPTTEIKEINFKKFIRTKAERRKELRKVNEGAKMITNFDSE